MKLRSWLAALFIIIGVSVVSGQVATGTPPYGSFGGGPFDTVNLGNLNVHFSVPIFNKPGRGPAFAYNLAYDSSIWSFAEVSGSTVWEPAPNWGWQGVTEVATGYITDTAKIVPHSCYDPEEGGWLPETIWTFTGYRDRLGIHHTFSAQTTDCDGVITPATQTAADGSGYTINANGSSVYITTRSGQVIHAPVNNQAGAGSFIDPNGNQINVNNSNQFFDTLSSTTPVLTISGSGTPASPTEYQYTAPSGATATYTVNYTQYTVQTDFGVAGISEYGPLSNALVSSITLSDNSSYAFTYEKTPGTCTPLSGTYSTNCITGRIKEVTLPTGGTITYAYTGGSNGIESDGSTAGFTRTLNPGGEWQYSRSIVTGSPGTGSTWTTTVVDPNGNDTVINFAEDGSTTNLTYNFYETQRQVKQLISGTQTLLATSIRCYNAHYASCSTATVSSPITQTDVYNQLPNNSIRLSEVLYNSYGLVTDDKEYNYGVAMGSAPGTTDLVRETAISYASLTNGIVNKPSSVTVYDWTSGSKVTLASTSYAYDGTAVTTTTGTPQHDSITGSRGNLTTLTTSTSSTASLSKTFTYYDTGNPYVVTDVNGTTTTTYAYSQVAQGSTTASCGNSFPTGVTIAGPGVSLSTSTVWNCVGGMATQATDPNGNNVSSNYTDPDFWRPANVYDQENNETTISYIGETAVEATLQNFNGGNSASDFRNTVDGFGRPILSQRLQAPGATDYDTAETDYNNIGQPSRSTMPFSAAAGGKSSSAPAANTTYDALGRVATIMDNDGGTVSYTYTNNDILQAVSGTQTFQKQFEYDGLGRLTSVCEISSTLTGFGNCGQSNPEKGFLTNYTYDALGHLLTVTQNAQAATGSRQSRSFTYDMLGRMKSESNPETGNSGTNGTVNYTYDSVSPCGDGSNYSYPGSLVQKKDNVGNYTCYAYDGLHRLTKAGNSSVPNTTLREFVYDSETSYPTGVSVINGKTQMVEAKTINTSNLNVNVTDEFFSYSPRGELTDVYESTPHSGGYYHTTTSYWATGALETLTGIPGVPTLYYGASNKSGAGLDGEGRYTQVTASGTGTTPVTNVTYSPTSTTNPLGALTGVTFGATVSGNDSDSFAYDPNTGRMTGYTFSVNSKTDAGALTWNPNGTLVKLVIVDSLPSATDSQTCTYTYDDLARIGGEDTNGYSVDCPGNLQQLFTYDAFGNVKKSGTISFLPIYSTATNQFTISGANVQYDGNGNLLTDNLNNTYTWDPNWGNPGSFNSTTLIYDGLGRMVEQQNGSAYTQILYSPMGKTALMNGQTLTKAFVYLPGGATAIYNSSGLAYYRHADWLGSSRLTSTVARTVDSDSAYAPFGEQYDPSGTPDASFTGQNADTTSSLYDFTFREHSPSQGRWISPDPAGAAAVDPTNPQSWNRYSYVGNNPLSFVDPFGLTWVYACVEYAGSKDCEWSYINDPGDDSGGGDEPGGNDGGSETGGGGTGVGAANNPPTWNNQGKNLNCKAAAANTRNIAIDSHNPSLSDIFKVPNFIEAGIAGGLGSINPILKGAGWGAVATGFGEAAAIGLGAAAIYNYAEWGVKNNAPFEAQQNAIYNNAVQQCDQQSPVPTGGSSGG